ncbi:hypothetical protein EB077_12265, partial [bacterium]|nr:hypothetical protein [bacterium]
IFHINLNFNTTFDRMKSFMALSALLYQGEVVENSSYREIIYNTLKFGGEGYTNGMICKFMVLHNIIKEGLSKGG